MSDPLDLFQRLVTIARAAIATPQQFEPRVPYKTARAIADEVKVERFNTHREPPRIIDAEALLLADTLCLLVEARDAMQLVRANLLARAGEELLNLVMLVAEDAAEEMRRGAHAN